MVFGYHCQSLQIDASRRSSHVVPLHADLLADCIGGVGLGSRLLHQANAAMTDALDPDAPIVIAFSPMIGSPLTTSARFALVSKSPLTHRLNDSLCGSRFAIAGKACGVDAIQIVGKCDRPSIVIVDGTKSTPQVRFEDADAIWGMELDDAQDAIGNRFGTHFSELLIGPAGEKQVLFATVAHDGRHAGRGGTGAVFGSKNIKAILVNGSQRVRWHNPDALTRRAKDWAQKSLGPATAKYRELGTIANLEALNRLHAMPTRNFQLGSTTDVGSISFEELRVANPKKSGCAACNIGCEHFFAPSHDGGTAGSVPVRLEYESSFALGPLCGIADRDVVLHAARRCDQLGMDTISTGGTIAFAMECRQAGALPSGPEFGDGNAFLELIAQIASRTDLGDVLAGGSRNAAASFGKETLRLAAQVKGLELPGYEPRSMPTLALGLAVGTRGADHNRSSAYEVDLAAGERHKPPTEETVRRAIEVEDRAAILDSLVLCKFIRNAFDDVVAESAEALREITGWNLDGDDLRKASRRIIATKKLFNIEAGWKSNEDWLPERFFEQVLPDDERSRLDPDNLRAAISQYYRLRGWDTDGIPTDEHLAQIGWSHAFN